MPRSVEVQKQTLRWRKVLPLVAVTLIPGSTDENTWSDPTLIANSGPGEHAASDETATIQIVDVERRPIHGSYTISVQAHHVSGMTRVRGILDNGTSVYQTTPVAGFDTSDFNAAVLSRWQNGIFTFIFNTADITFSASTRLCKVWFCTDAVDGQNRQVSIEFVAHQNAIAPTETKYVSLTTNSPSDLTGDGSAAHPWASLDYARTHVADGGTIKCVDAGNYPLTRAVSFLANERWITITTDLDQDEVQIRGDGGLMTPKVQRLWFSGITLYRSSFAQFDGGDSGNSKIVMENCLVTSDGRQYAATGPNNGAWISLGQNDYWWFIDTTAYDMVWGLTAERCKLINCVIDKLSGLPFSSEPDLLFNVVVSDFNADYLNDSPDPTPIGANPADYTSTLNGGIDASQTTLVVTSTSGTGGPDGTASLPSSYPYYLHINSETVKVTGRTSTTLTIVRAQRSTSAATHSNGAAITSLDATFHRDVCHYGYHGVEHKVAYGLRTTDDVSATMFRIEALHGPDGYFLDMLWQNCEMDGVVDGTNSGGVHSDQNGLHTNVVWDNVWNPTNAWDFVNSEPTKPNFSASNVYMIRCGFHWRNFLAWVLPLSGVNTGPALPAGVTLVDCYEPPEGLQPETCPLTAEDVETGITYIWSASGWSSRSRAQLYVYNTLTQALVFTLSEIPVSGGYLWTGAEYGVAYTALVREENDGSGEKKYGQGVTETHAPPPAIGTDGEGFTQLIVKISGATRYTWTPYQSKTIQTVAYSASDGTLSTLNAIFVEAP